MSATAQFDTPIRFNRMFRQGDVTFIKVASIPEDLKPAKRNADGTTTVAHSESGHHHVVDASVEVLEQDDFVMYLRTSAEDAVAKHLKNGNDKHQSALLDGSSTYKVVKQRQGYGSAIGRAID